MLDKVRQIPIRRNTVQDIASCRPMKNDYPYPIAARRQPRRPSPANPKDSRLHVRDSFSAPGKRCTAFLLRALLVCLLLFTANACTLSSKNLAPNVAGSAISNTALSTLGTPYRLGGTSPRKGFDCSGLVAWAYARHGLSLPRTTSAQSKVGQAVSKDGLQQGDIVVFKAGWGLHTGIYTGRGKFVHSPSRGKTVREDKLDSEYWRDRFVYGRRV